MQKANVSLPELILKELESIKEYNPAIHFAAEQHCSDENAQVIFVGPLVA